MSPGAFRVLRFSVIGMGIAILALATVFALQLWRVVREAGLSTAPVASPGTAPSGLIIGRLEPADLGLAPGTRMLSVAAAAEGRFVLLVEAPNGGRSLLLVEAGAFKMQPDEE